MSLFQASALEVVYSKTNKLGMRVVSLMRKNSAMGEATMDGKSGVKTLWRKTNQIKAQTTPIPDPHITARVGWIMDMRWGETSEGRAGQE